MVAENTLPAMNPKKSKRIQLFVASCFSFCVTSFLFWKAVTDTRGELAVLYLARVVLPFGIGFSVWLAVHCLRRKEDDTFYDGLDGE